MTGAAGPRPGWAAVADAVGHCVLIFAFVPALAPIPSWIAFEVSNPLNTRDPVVLSFVLVRGVNLLLETFRARVALGVLSGALAGLVVSAWAWSGGRMATTPGRLALGAFAGVVGTGLALALELAVQRLDGGARPGWSSGAVPFEMLSGLACGMLAAPSAVRFLHAGSQAKAAPAQQPVRHA